jgi:hypothetical protein
MSDYALRIGIGLAAIVMIAAIGMVVLALVRRRLGEQSSSDAADFSLAELRRLRDHGQMSPDEFDRAKARIVSQTQETLAPTEPGKDKHGTDEPKMDERR